MGPSSILRSPMLSAFLDASGLGKYAQKIIEVTDAESIGDLRMLEGPMVDDVIKHADLKIVPAQKLRRAIGELRGEASPLAAASVGGYPSESCAASPKRAPVPVEASSPV